MGVGWAGGTAVGTSVGVAAGAAGGAVVAVGCAVAVAVGEGMAVGARSATVEDEVGIGCGAGWHAASTTSASKTMHKNFIFSLLGYKTFPTSLDS